jgi:hypothetical protein
MSFISTCICVLLFYPYFFFISPSCSLCNFTPIFRSFSIHTFFSLPLFLSSSLLLPPRRLAPVTRIMKLHVQLHSSSSLFFFLSLSLSLIFPLLHPLTLTFHHFQHFSQVRGTHIAFLYMCRILPVSIFIASYDLRTLAWRT